LYELRLSEDEAVRRVAAARLVRKFPELLDAVAAGELHLTGLLLLGPHLTRENFGEVMARAKHRSKKEITKLVRILDPLPDVPARIEAFGPQHPGVPRTNPTWAEQVASFCPVRELTPGDRPRDWVAPDEVSAPARVNHPLRYKVQFTATEEYVDLMERAAALLSSRGRCAAHNALAVELDFGPEHICLPVQKETCWQEARGEGSFAHLGTSALCAV
jgi:hypothetical protein